MLSKEDVTPENRRCSVEFHLKHFIYSCVFWIQNWGNTHLFTVKGWVGTQMA